MLYLMGLISACFVMALLDVHDSVRYIRLFFLIGFITNSLYSLALLKRTCPLQLRNKAASFYKKLAALLTQTGIRGINKLRTLMQFVGATLCG